MQRLLLILTEFPPSFGGMQTHAAALSQRLHALGHPIAVATYRCPPRAVLPTFPFPVHRCLSRLSYHANLRTLAGLARAHRADLIYSSTVYHGQLTASTGLPMLCRSAGNDVLRPWIAWPFEAGSSLVNIPAFERYLYHRWRRLEWPAFLEGSLLDARRELMRASALSMRRIFANSEFTSSRLQDLGVPKDRILLLPGGVDTQSFSPSPSPKAALRAQLNLPVQSRILLTACRLVPKKGLETLLHALSQMVRKDPSLLLLIAGDGTGRASCERLIAHLALQCHARILGYIPHTLLPSYFHAADAFVLPSCVYTNPRTGLTDVETMGRALCEANAAGLPVVATNSGGIPSVIRSGWNGLLARENNVGDLIAHLETLATHPQIADSLRANGLQRARDEFDWRVIVDAHARQFALYQ
jgi:phosphatidyl-myo-inositol dimannoside synthase